MGGGVLVELVEETKNSDSVTPRMLKVDGRESVFGDYEVQRLVKPSAVTGRMFRRDSLFNMLSINYDRRYAYTLVKLARQVKLQADMCVQYNYYCVHTYTC